MLKKILVTRKLEDYHHTKAHENGFEFLEYDFIKISYEKFDHSKYWEECPNLIFTSINGVKGFEENIDSLEPYLNKNVFSISENTRTYLKSLGFTNIFSENNSEDLANLILKNHHSGDYYIYFTTNDRRSMIERYLKEKSLQLYIEIVYSKEYNIQHIHEAYDAIMFYSPSQIKAFIEENVYVSNIPVFCIGKTTAIEAATIGFEQLYIASEPTTNHLIELIIKYNLNHK